MRFATDPNTKENAMNRFLITLTLTGTLFLTGCQSPTPAPKAEEKAAAAPAAATPPRWNRRLGR